VAKVSKIGFFPFETRKRIKGLKRRKRLKMPETLIHATFAGHEQNNRT